MLKVFGMLEENRKYMNIVWSIKEKCSVWTYQCIASDQELVHNNIDKSVLLPYNLVEGHIIK